MDLSGALPARFGVTLLPKNKSLADTLTILSGFPHFAKKWLKL
jgi:hypothetical protein